MLPCRARFTGTFGPSQTLRIRSPPLQRTSAALYGRVARCYGAFRDKFGPGLLFASTAVGLSHLVQSTRAGANYGMTLWWLLVFVSIIKYPAFRYGSMYAAATGKTLIASYERQGKLAVVVYGFALSIDALVGVPAMALVTAGLCKHIFSLTLGDRNMIFLLLIGAAAILISGKYRVFENLAKVLVVAFSVFTIIAASLALSRLDFASTTIAAPIAYDRARNPVHDRGRRRDAELRYLFGDAIGMDVRKSGNTGTSHDTAGGRV